MIVWRQLRGVLAAIPPPQLIAATRVSALSQNRLRSGVPLCPTKTPCRVYFWWTRRSLQSVYVVGLTGWPESPFPNIDNTKRQVASNHESLGLFLTLSEKVRMPCDSSPYIFLKYLLTTCLILSLLAARIHRVSWQSGQKYFFAIILLTITKHTNQNHNLLVEYNRINWCPCSHEKKEFIVWHFLLVPRGDQCPASVGRKITLSGCLDLVEAWCIDSYLLLVYESYINGWDGPYLHACLLSPTSTGKIWMWLCNVMICLYHTHIPPDLTKLQTPYFLFPAKFLLRCQINKVMCRHGVMTSRPEF